MALAKLAMLLVIAFCGFFSMAMASGAADSPTVLHHHVGELFGWTSVPRLIEFDYPPVRVNYQDWAADDFFYLNDVLDFIYDNQFENVKQVNYEDFQSCNGNSPIATYTSGSDSITLDRPGHFYFISDYPGHCLGGMKVDIMVSAMPLSSPNPIWSPSPSAAPYNQPEPDQNSASFLYSSMLLLFLALCVRGMIALLF